MPTQREGFALFIVGMSRIAYRLRRADLMSAWPWSIRVPIRVFWGTSSEMLSGFNNNYRYRGVLFHVQTEDSGVSNPHVITHLFYGGNILASEKQSYSDKLELPDLEDVVRELMETQHKAMLKRLQRGLHDSVILDRLGPDAFSEAAPEERSDTDAALVEPDGDPVEPDGAPVEPDDGNSTDTAARLDPIAAAEPASVPAPSPAATATPADDDGALGRGFGEGVVSQKPLDEVVLEYLVENARKRKRRSQ